MDFTGRRARLDAALDAAGIDLFFAPPSGDLEYLTGWRRRPPSFGNYEHAHQWSVGAFFRPGRDPVVLVLKAQAAFKFAEGVSGDVVEIDYRDDAQALFADAVARLGGGRRVGLSARTWASSSVRIQHVLPDAELVDADDVLNGLRRIKTAEEVDAMARASKIADDVMGVMAAKVVPGVTELELASEVDYQLRVHGSRTPSFDTGVFAMGPKITGRDFGVRVSGRVLEEGDCVCFDFGGVVDGYCSDFGRAVHVGEPTEEFVRSHELVVAAEAAGAEAAKPGVTAAEVDRATRAVLDETEYGEWYRHRTGHCIGLDTHERPFLSVEDETPLEVGMAFTIEPSIFWPGRVGVRVEDLYVLEEDGCRNLNAFGHDVLAGGV